MPGCATGKVHSVLLLATALCLQSCTGTFPKLAPSIELTTIPPYGPGSGVKLFPIAGKVHGQKPGQRIVLFARSGIWYVQPTTLEPFTSIQRESTWSNTTHPGSGYAALLVNSGYRPRPTMDSLPPIGGDVLALQSVADENLPIDPDEKQLPFSGYQWRTRYIPNLSGGSNNYYSSQNVSVDRAGKLHLQLTGAPGHWISAEVMLQHSLGYGSYRFVVRDISHLEPAAVLSLSLVDDKSPLRQMDIELSQWGESDSENAQFVIQPYYVAANTARFNAPSGPVTFMIEWSPGRAVFKALRGAGAGRNAPALFQHEFTSGVPLAGNDVVHMNLYAFDNPTSPLRRPSEIVVENFEYLP